MNNLLSDSGLVASSSEEVFYCAAPLVRLNDTALATLKALAQRTRRKRARICTHPDTKNALHEMIILHARGAYVRPHRHLGKSESFHVIEGEADIILFDEDGRVEHIIPMGEHASGKHFYYRLNSFSFHTLIIHSDLFIFHETTNGPFRPEDTSFATWAPEESDSVSVERFLNQDFTLLKKQP